MLENKRECEIFGDHVFNVVVFHKEHCIDNAAFYSNNKAHDKGYENKVKSAYLFIFTEKKADDCGPGKGADDEWKTDKTVGCSNRADVMNNCCSQSCDPTEIGGEQSECHIEVKWNMRGKQNARKIIQ